MRARGQLAVAVLLVAAVVGAGVLLEGTVGVRVRGDETRATAFSGAWYCPHGGGRGWSVELSIANPGDRPVDVQVRSFGSDRPGELTTATVEPGRQLRLPVTGARARERSTVVEYFGGWVAVGWIADANGRQTGVAAEPCAPAAGRTWLLPDGTTFEGHDDVLVVVNPFASDAVFTITLFSDSDPPTTPQPWTEFVLKARRSAVFPLNERLLGKQTVGAVLRTSIGRVAAASVGSTASGGLRASIGVLGAPGDRRLLPGGSDSGQSDLAVLDLHEAPVGLTARTLAADALEVPGGLEEASVQGRSAVTFTIVTEGAATIELMIQQAAAFTAARRSAGVGPDQGATTGVVGPGTAWVVPSAVARRALPRIVLANPGDDPAMVRLTLLPAGDAPEIPAPITVDVPAGRTVVAPPEFTEALRFAAVVVEAETGAVVPAAVTRTLGEAGYAVVVGVPFPERWIGSTAQ